MRRCTSRLVGLLYLTLFLLTPGIAIAQTATATILGQVTDDGGGALPGVTVTLNSPALQVASMSTVTDERGEYRITPVPIGTYSVEYTLPGFQTLRLQDVRVTTGFVAKLDQVMKIGALAETVTVSGQTPLVDVTQASTATTLETTALEMIPSGTNGIVGILAFVPGAQSNVEVGGSAITDTNIFTSTDKVASCGRCSKGSLPPRVRRARAARTTTSTRSKRRGSRRAQTAPTRRSVA